MGQAKRELEREWDNLAVGTGDRQGRRDQNAGTARNCRGSTGTTERLRRSDVRALSPWDGKVIVSGTG